MIVPATGDIEPVYWGNELQFSPNGARPMFASVTCHPINCAEPVVPNFTARLPEAEVSVIDVALVVRVPDSVSVDRKIFATAYETLENKKSR